MERSPTNHEQILNLFFRCALLGVACDLPAARKTCGFLSYTANLGCSRCYQNFSRGFAVRNCYDNFDRDSWEMRSNSRHCSDVKKILKCTTKTERSKKESDLGCHYSSLLDLPYFCPIEMLLIDPMHNLFWGTAKHFARDLWIERSILDTTALAKIGDRLKSTIVPAGLGRLPEIRDVFLLQISGKIGLFTFQYTVWVTFYHHLNLSAGDTLF